MKRALGLFGLLFAILYTGLSVAQSGFPSSGRVYPQSIVNATNVFRCQRASSPFTDCGYSNKAFNLGSCTVTVATPAVFTKASHGLVAGSKIKFTTTGALPTGLSVGTTYFVIATGLTTSAFEVSTSAGGSAVNTSGSQSGTMTCWPNYTVASKFQPSALTLNPLVSKIQVVIPAPATGTLFLDGMTICNAASSGTTQLWSCANSPTAITFNGAATLDTSTCGTLCVSDTIVYSMGALSAYTFAYDVAPNSNGSYMTSMSSTSATPSASSSNYVAYSHVGLAQSGTQTRSASYTTNVGGSTGVLFSLYRVLNIP